MDYSNSPLVESVPDRMHGVPVVRGSRVPVETIEIGMDLGQSAEELASHYGLNLDDVRALVAYIAKAQANALAG